MPEPAETTAADDPPAAPPDSPAVAAAKERNELRRLELERRRLGLDDRVARAEAQAKVAKGSVDAVKAYLPASLDIPVEKDALTTQGDATGLASTYAGRAAHQSIDDIADQVVNATNSMRNPELLIVADASFVMDQQLSGEIDVRLGLLERKLTDAGVPEADDKDTLADVMKGLEGTPGGDEVRTFGPAAGALASLLPSALTTLTRLFAHQYTASGTAIADPDLGVDLRLAGALRGKMSSDPSVEILVNRLWVPPNSPLLDRILKTADRLLKLQRLAAEADVARDRAATLVTRKNEEILAGRDQRKALIEQVPSDKDSDKSGWQAAWDAVTKEMADLAAALVDLEGDLATKESAAEELAALVTEIESFLTGVLTAPEGAPAPLFGAMRGEWLRGNEQRVIVYARVLSAGVDQVLDLKLGPDKRCVLSGASIEYAAVGHPGELLFSGVYDGLWTASMKLTDPSTFAGEAVGYVAVANSRRPPPAPAGSS
ncbi:MAG TPA: hypothetical protein PK324_03505 [Nocardioides sp.]|uniref:hypothetical protein n=1 Tax=uncultured Nocardioides sp. TaxID=198441 RepID=UPI002609FA4D|nr:hypothetical protein [uncultured Nocardioides sp.]HRD59316.1 hypothetical protein [Nocardioides sp.]HRK44671.1 hypothetical protein [Nocardioides sp.]